MTLLGMQQRRLRGADPLDFDFEDGVSHLFNFSPSTLGLGPERRSTRVLPLEHRLSGSLTTGLEPPSSSSYPASTGFASWGDYVLPTSGGFPAPVASPQSRMMAGDIDHHHHHHHHHLNYLNTYPERSATLNNNIVASGSVAVAGHYTFGTTAGPLILPSSPPSGISDMRQPQNHLFIPASQTSYLDSQSSIPAVSMSQTRHLDMTSIPDTRQTLFSPDSGLYDLGSVAHSMLPGHDVVSLEPDIPPPSLSFSIPGMPNAEEAFLSQFNDPTASIGVGIGDVLIGEPQQDLTYPFSSDFQPSLGLLPHPNIFGTDEQELDRNLYNAHLRTGSPSSSESSRASQKRLREQIEPLTPTSGLQSDDWSVASRVKRQRVNKTDDSANSVQSETPQKEEKKKKAFSVSSPFSFGSGGEEEEEEEEEEEDGIFGSGNDDSDAYVPSSSSSPMLPTIMFTPSSPPGESTPIATKAKRGKRKGKGKAKGSAARALAMVTKAREQQDFMAMAELGYTEEAEGEDFDSLSSSTINGAIDGPNDGGERRAKGKPLPVPVPNLIKKSRGRKVPYVPSLRGGEGVGEGVPVTGVVNLAPGSRRGRKRTDAAGSSRDRSAGQEREYGQMQASTAEERTFVCMVPGCGKCFVRGEHLKRHVRSIHTDDKPHKCPYKGCGKSFSRRDNLGQHVRIHLDQ